MLTMAAALLLLGMLAGALSTVAGVGGGMLLVIALSLVLSPAQALASTAPALLISNAHRWWLFRRQMERRIVKPLVVGALPGSLIGALFVVALPAWFLRLLMIAGAMLAIARTKGWVSLRVSPRALTAGAFGVGMVAATSGGAGLLISPLLIAAGISGEAYVASTAVAAVAMHTGRIVGYGSVGLMSVATLLRASVLVAALLVGNLIGRRIRGNIGKERAAAIELYTLVACVALAAAGAAR